MLVDTIPAKTAAGRLEIEKRTQRIGPRQRMVLISINGERKLSEVRRQFETLGDVDSVIGELAEAGLIEMSGPPQLATHNGAAVEPAAPVAAKAPAPEQSHERLEPLPLARKYMNDTVVANLGLRAFLFTLKIEKCYSARELYLLLPEFRRQLRKVMQNEEVVACHERAEALIARI